MSIHREPLHEQIAQTLRDEIRAGLRPGTKLDSESALSKRFTTSIVTVREALLLLAREGLLIRKQGSGTYVAEPPKSLHLAILTDGHLYNAQTSPFFMSAAMAMVRLFAAAGYAARCYMGAQKECPADKDRPVTYWSDAVKKQEVLGVAALATQPNATWMEPLTARQVPIVGPAHRYEYGVTHDHANFARRAVEYLVARGRRRIALLGWHSRQEPSAYYDRTLDELRAAHGLQTPPDWAPPAASHLQVGETWRQFRRLWSASPLKPDGLVIGDDWQAREVVPALLECGIRIPEDLLLLAHSNKGSGLSYPFPVVELEHDPESYGEAMGKLLLQRLRGEAIAERRVVSPFALVEPEVLKRSRPASWHDGQVA